jgi:hypothetical protein
MGREKRPLNGRMMEIFGLEMRNLGSERSGCCIKSSRKSAIFGKRGVGSAGVELPSWRRLGVRISVLGGSRNRQKKSNNDSVHIYLIKSINQRVFIPHELSPVLMYWTLPTAMCSLVRKEIKE